MRGDHSTGLKPESGITGSSSHAWGPHLLSSSCSSPMRFILTCVGTTRRLAGRTIVLAVHPHMRGDHDIDDVVLCRHHGSSSHAWGPLSADTLIRHAVRFIPTGVGTTVSFRSRARSLAVHPHGRGDHRGSPRPPKGIYGSSPRAWGPPPSMRKSALSPRFIPTGVGTTSAFCPDQAWRTVHPHGRGDHSNVASWMTDGIGSSPRAWGPPV